MKRNLVLFIVSFIIAAAVCGGVYLMLQKQEEAKQQQTAEQAQQQASTEQPAQPVEQPQPTATPEPQPQVEPEPQPEPQPEPVPQPAAEVPGSQAVVQAFVEAVQRGDIAAARGMIGGMIGGA